MIKQKKLPANVSEKLPLLKSRLEKDMRITACYLFGSAAKGELKPLSDIDIALLLRAGIKPGDYTGINMELSVTISEILCTEEIDLIFINNAPARFTHRIIYGGKMLFCNNRKELIDFISRRSMEHLDFYYYKKEFNQAFRSGIRAGK